ncbi:MAG: YqiJ family protein [Bacteroidetes bacterium]|nr:YqiJ family protein [Bacteroidota bacterium]MBU1116932.1 YqiJ family protein [Bacteroidota bacterium]MBU1799398.1 YqiJ family protein [Bacteroidota bacterium]
MMEFVLSPENIPFTVSIGLMIAIGLIEGVGMLIGMGLSNLIDSLLPDLDADLDLDALDEFEAPSLFSILLSWLRVGKTPIIALLVAGLTAFGLTGFVIQSVTKNILGFYLPWYLAILPAFFITLPIIRVSSKILEKIIPSDESDAVSSSTFIGLIATITIGTAKRGSPAEAKLHDKLGHSHYIMVEPDIDGEEFKQGEQVLLVKDNNRSFTAIKNTNINLTD